MDDDELELLGVLESEMSRSVWRDRAEFDALGEALDSVYGPLHDDHDIHLVRWFELRDRLEAHDAFPAGRHRWG